MSEITPLYAASIADAHNRLNSVEKRIGDLEKNGAVADLRFKHIQGSLDAIQGSISKVNWIIVSTVVGAVIAWILGGGLNVIK